MSSKFCPGMESLEGREVPASFSFRYSDGTAGLGLFSTPDGVDPGQGTQFLDVTDMTLTNGGVNYTVQSGATAMYVYGFLTEVNGVATAPGNTLYLYGDRVSNGTQTVPLVCDGADTRATFTLPDGTVGAISYNIPWDSIDASASSASVSPANFRLNIAGQNIESSTANFTSAPTLHFAYGEFAGVTFAVDTSGVSGFPYTALSATLAQGGNLLTATKAGTGQLQPVLILADQKTAVLFFQTGANDTKNTVLPEGTRIRIRVEAQGVNPYDYDAATVVGETVGDVAQQIYENMKTAGWDVALLESGKGVVVNGRIVDVPGMPRETKPVTKAGINYSGMAQPPVKAVGVQLLEWTGEGWIDRPKPE